MYANLLSSWAAAAAAAAVVVVALQAEVSVLHRDYEGLVQKAERAKAMQDGLPALQVGTRLPQGVAGWLAVLSAVLHWEQA